MSKFLRLAIWLLLTALVVWAAVIGFWRVSDIRPEVRDLVLYLGVLPLGVFAVLGLLKHSLDGARDKASRTESTDQEDGGLHTGDEAPQPGRATPLAVLATALQLPVGSDPAAVLGALTAPLAPQLHPKLKDSSGFPVFASWVEDVDVAAAAQQLEAASDPRPGAQRPTDEHLRALGLMMPVAQDLLAQVAAEEWLAVSQRPRLQITIFLPQEWPAASREPAAAWLAAEALACGIAADRCQVEALPVAAADEVWRHLAEIAPTTPAAPAPVLHLLLACDSRVGEASVQRLDRSGHLLSARQQEGVVPGEGAAGLVLLAADAEGAFALPPRAVLRAHAVARQGISWQARTAILQMKSLMEDALAKAHGTASADVNALVSDADMRRSRATAVAGLAAQALEHLEPEADCVATGGGCGHTGIASPLALIALAAERAVVSDGPVLALAVAETEQRAIALVSPPDKPDTDEVSALPATPQAT